MKDMKKFISLLLAVLLMLSSASVFAETGDVWNNESPATLYKRGLEIAKNPVLGFPIAKNMDKYLYEYDGRLYEMKYINELFKTHKNDFLKHVDVSKAVKSLNDIEVNSVSIDKDLNLVLTFSDNIAADAAPENFEVMIGKEARTVEMVTVDGAKATLKVNITTKRDGVMGSVKVKGLKSADGQNDVIEKTLTFEAAIIARLVLETNKPAGITADGKSTMTITAKVMAPNGELLDLNGEVQFTTTKGQFAQASVVLDQGVAKAQLISEYYPSDMDVYVSATIISVPDYREYEGIRSQDFIVKFLGEQQDPHSVTMVSLKSANARQADRIMVTFSDVVTPDMEAAIRANKIAITGADGNTYERIRIRVDEVYPVEDIIVNETDRRLVTLILDVDNKFQPMFPVANTPVLDWNQMQLMTDAEKEMVFGGYLKDFATHNVSVPTMIEGALLPNEKGVDFLFDDINYPSVFNVKYDPMTGIVRVEFKEAVAEDHAEEIVLKRDKDAPYAVDFQDPKTGENAKGIWVNPHFMINGRALMITAGEVSTLAEREYAEKHPVVLVNKVYVSADDFPMRHEGYLVKGQVDTRKYVSIKLDLFEEMRRTAGEKDLEIALVGDWAGMTDARNVIQSQTISFKIEEDTEPLTWEVEVQSPEQYLIKFSRPIMSGFESGAAMTVKDIFGITRSPGNWLPYGLEADKGEFVVSVLDHQNPYIPMNDEVVQAGLKVYQEQGMALPVFRPDYYPTARMLKADDLVEGQYFLLELTKDWEEIYNTEVSHVNYHSPSSTPHTIRVQNVMTFSGVELTETTKTVSTPQDVVSPSVLFMATTPVLHNDVMQTGVKVFMDEPVKTLTKTTSPAEGTTMSQEQKRSKDGVPPLAVEFTRIRSTDTRHVILGEATDLFEDDYVYTVVPAEPLTPGEWEVAVRSISDDIGNTIKTVTHRIIVKEKPVDPPSEILPMVEWVAFDNVDHGSEGSNVHDRIYVKFNTAMKGFGTNSVTRTQNWLLNGQTLDKESKIEFGIKSRDGKTVLTTDENQHMDGITISMPPAQFKGSLSTADEINIDFSCTVTFADFFEATNGKALQQPLLRDGSKSWKVPLEDNLVNNDKAVAKAFSEAEDMNLAFEAYYGNPPSKIAPFKFFRALYDKLVEIWKNPAYGYDRSTKTFTKKDDFTKSTWDAFMAAYGEAFRLLAEQKATQLELENALDTLNARESELKLRATADELKVLTDKIQDVEANYKEDDYTVDTWKVLAEALDAAKKAAESEDTTKEDVDAHVQKLNDAIAQLKKKPAPQEKFDELEALINLSKVLKEADYTAESWAPFAEKLAAAETVFANKESTLEEVQKAIDELNTAKGALVEAVKKATAEQIQDLKDAITAAEAVDLSNYEDDANKTAFQAALAAAKAVDAKADADKTEKEVLDATQALNDAKGKLTPKGGGGGSDVVFEVDATDPLTGWNPIAKMYTFHLVRTAASKKTAIKSISYDGTVLDPAESDYEIDGDNITIVIDDSSLEGKNAADLIGKFVVTLADDTTASVVMKGSAPMPKTIDINMTYEHSPGSYLNLMFNLPAGKTIKSIVAKGVTLKGDGADPDYTIDGGVVTIILVDATVAGSDNWDEADVKANVVITFESGETAKIVSYTVAP